MGRTKTALLNPIHTNMTLEEIEQITPVVEEQELAPIPDGKKKAKKAKKGKKKSARKARKSKKAKKSRKARKATKKQKARAARKAAKRARGGKTIAQCVVAALKAHKGPMA